MKKFRDLFEDSPAQDFAINQEKDKQEYKPRSKGELDFYNKHLVTKVKHPVAFDHQHTGEIQGDPEDHVGGKKQAEGEADTVMQGSSKIKESVSFTEFRQGLDEGVIDSLKKIQSSKRTMPVKFKTGQTIKVDALTAAAVLKVHDSLKASNAKKYRDSLEKSESSFMTMLDFAMQNA